MRTLLTVYSLSILATIQIVSGQFFPGDRMQISDSSPQLFARGSVVEVSSGYPIKYSIQLDDGTKIVRIANDLQKLCTAAIPEDAAGERGSEHNGWQLIHASSATNPDKEQRARDQRIRPFRRLRHFCNPLRRRV